MYLTIVDFRLICPENEIEFAESAILGNN